jgi:hypothetical protein
MKAALNYSGGATEYALMQKARQKVLDTVHLGPPLFTKRHQKVAKSLQDAFQVFLCATIRRGQCRELTVLGKVTGWAGVYSSSVASGY